MGTQSIGPMAWDSPIKESFPKSVVTGSPESRKALSETNIVSSEYLELKTDSTLTASASSAAVTLSVLAMSFAPRSVLPNTHSACTEGQT